jgi:guanylate kinase
LIAVLELGIAGAKKIYNLGMEATYIAIIPPTRDLMRERIGSTRKMNIAGINAILKVCMEHVNEIEECSFISERIINDDGETAYSDFKNCILSLFPFLKENYEQVLAMPVGKLMNLHLDRDEIDSVSDI